MEYARNSDTHNYRPFPYKSFASLAVPFLLNIMMALYSESLPGMMTETAFEWLKACPEKLASLSPAVHQPGLRQKLTHLLQVHGAEGE